MGVIASLIYPRTCALCARYIGEYNAGILCDECLRSLPRTEQAALPQNGTEGALIGITNTPSAVRKTMHLDHAAAFLFYEKDHPIRDLIHRMKYADRPDIGFQLGRQAAMEFQYAGFFDGIDLIIPMPLHPKRFRERGYNQSAFIARGISEVIGIPVDTDHVLRVRNTPKQALQSGEGRKTNVADAFDVLYPEQMYHKHILLVDDLITTGETSKACLKAMKRFRGAKFSVFALCKA